MKAYDTVKKETLDVSYDDLIALMRANRQVDLILNAEVTDSDGYLTWDVEHWSSYDDRRFIRTYELKGRTLRDFTTHNIDDVKAEFHPDKAKELQIS